MICALCIGGLDGGGARGVAPAAAAYALHGVRALSARTGTVTSGRRGPIDVSHATPEQLAGMIDAAVGLGARVASVEPPLNIETIAVIADKAREHDLALVVDLTFAGPPHRPLLDDPARAAAARQLAPLAQVFIVDEATARSASLLDQIAATTAARWIVEGDAHHLQLPGQPEALALGTAPRRRPAGFSNARTAALLARLACGEALVEASQAAHRFALAAASEAQQPEGEARKLVGLGGMATRAAARSATQHTEAPRADDERFMAIALEEAQKAAAAGDVPVGAVLVHEGEVIARAHNQREATSDPSAHAEVLALRAGAEVLGRWRLSGTTLYVTLEPCFMCAGALVNARVERLVIGALDEKAGATCSLAEVTTDPRLNHRVALTVGVCQRECAEQLQMFFADRR